MKQTNRIFSLTIIGILVGGSTVAFASSSQPSSQQSSSPVLVKNMTSNSSPNSPSTPKKTAGKDTQDEKFKNSPFQIHYTPPPNIGAPDMVRLQGGGTRGTTDSLWVEVLAPDHLGLTTQAQPELYWYINRATDYPVQLTVIEDLNPQPLVETLLSSPTQPGIQRVPTSLLGLNLVEGKAYQWFICVILDPENRSQDVMAGGWIQYEESRKALNQNVASASPSQAASLYAREGFWYDALSALSAAPEEPVESQALINQRASLLQQVGLTELAALDAAPHHENAGQSSIMTDSPSEEHHVQ